MQMILILSDKVEEIAKMLDDDALSAMIEDLARALCSAHHVIQERIELGIDDKNSKLDIPLPYKKYKSFEFIAQWRDWSATCIANYNYLIEMAKACCIEHKYRFIRYAGIYGDEKYFKAIWWCVDNRPDLAKNLKQVGYALQDKDDISFEDAEYEEQMTLFPLCIPDEYIIYKAGAYAGDGEYHAETDLIASYRNYYRAMLGRDAIWTRRQKPGWL
jgi:hypothetical protein